MLQYTYYLFSICSTKIQLLNKKHMNLVAIRRAVMLQKTSMLFSYSFVLKVKSGEIMKQHLSE